MVKDKALHNFWSSFGVPAYDEATVPEDASFPRITYNVAEGVFDTTVSMRASIWSRSKSWVKATEIKDEIFESLGIGGGLVKYDGGVIWLKPSSPFAQRMSDTDDSIRRIVINIDAEYI